MKMETERSRMEAASILAVGGCLYVVPFLRYSASKNGVNGVRVVQDH